MAWTPGGGIVYTSKSGDHSELWIIEADGKNPRQLSADGGSNWAPVVSPDGRTIVFTSDRTGPMNLWKLDIDGGNPKQLTYGNSDSHAESSPAGKWVVYNSASSGKVTLWKDSIEGGEPKQLTKQFSYGPVISLDGKYIASVYQGGLTGKPGMAAIPFEGGEPLKILDVPVRKAPQDQFPWIRWAPDGRSLTYIDDLNGVSNIWSRPVSGGPPKQLTHFTSGQIFNFAWSRDGKQLALARGTETSDVVLITNFR